MNKKIGIVSVIVVLVAAVAVTVATVSTRSPEPSGGVGAGVAVASASSGETDAAAEEAYQILTADLKELENKARTKRSMDSRIEILKQMDVVLAEFIDDYAGTPEAAMASFEAGIVNFSLQKPEKTIRYLETFLAGAADPEREKEAYSHFYLAEAYKQSGKIDDAEAEYKLLLKSYGDVDQQLTSMVQQNLSMMDSERRMKVGSSPVDFAVTSITGEKLSPQKFKGKVLLLDFWATWCAPCRQEMPNVIKVYDRYKDRGFEIVGISLDRDRASFDKYIDKNNMDWPQFYDGKFWQNEVATLYGVKSIPATYLIDKRGKIRYKSLRGSQLESAVKELLAE